MREMNYLLPAAIISWTASLAQLTSSALAGRLRIDKRFLGFSAAALCSPVHGPSVHGMCHWGAPLPITNAATAR